MKILAIRGKNLASLARPFAVDFTQEPLAKTGIFAITGPTGAGKSTLLDALCLALYDDMPRLPREGYRGQNLPDVSGETIAPRDARNILRRGAAEGFAEVDFVGNDGVAYRAHWSVRRARTKAEGRLQNSELSLLRLADEQSVGGARKTEVLAAIAQRIGLSFEQFTRAVLLAQNEFSAFLKASDDKRAELLQTLTGTDLFADLSRRAYQRSKTAEHKLNHLRERLAILQVLTPEERQQQELASRQAQLQVQSLELERSQLELQLQWYQQSEQLQQACQLAEAALLQAQTQEQAASVRHQQLAKVEAVQATRGLVEHLARLRQALLKTQANCQISQESSAASELQYRQIQAQLSAAQHQLEQKQAEYQGLQPQRLQARQLDTLIQTLVPRYAVAHQDLQSAQTLVADWQTQQLEAAARCEQLAAQHTQVKLWLSANLQWQNLAEHWEHWQTLLQQAKALLAQQTAAALALTQGNSQIERVNKACQRAQLSFEQAQHQLAQAEAQYQTQQRTAAQYDLELLAQQRQGLEQQRAHLQAAQQAWQYLQTTKLAVIKLQAEAEQLKTEQGQVEQSLQQAQAKYPQLERDSERAEHAWRLAEAACADQATRWRAQLNTGDACPVCGATEHPYAHQQPALDAVLAGLQQDALQQRQALKALEAALASGQARLQQYQQQQTRWQHNLSLACTTYEQAQVDWQVFSDLANPLELATGLQARLATQQQRILAIEQQEGTARHSYQQLALAQQVWQQLRQQVLQAQDELTGIETDLKQLQIKQQYSQQSHADLTAQLSNSLQVLSAAFAKQAWKDAWLQAPEIFEHQCKLQVETWQAQQHTAQQLAQQHLELSSLQTQLNFEWQQAQHHQERYQHQANQLQLELQVLQAQRTNLLAGEAVDAVESRWQHDLERLATRLATAQGSLEQAAQEQTRRAEAWAQLQALQQQYADQELQAQQNLTASLAELNPAGLVITESELGSLLTYSTAWLQQERAALQALKTASSQAQAVLAERQAQLAQHARLRRYETSVSTLKQTYAEHLIALTAAQQLGQELLLSLRADQQRREQALSLQAELEQLMGQARVWGQLNELIGAADGKKFRNFAQQYSLDVLLSYANRHLADLSRRYTLRRVRESLALLVLDQDMGGELRSVHSLSGGESFLVSLALALGLASLSSQRVKVESLFIDEGFGSLDTDSLRVAMDALDQLQAQGRKVGVISHVQEMTERIAVQIQVRRLSGGQSHIRVSG